MEKEIPTTVATPVDVEIPHSGVFIDTSGNDLESGYYSDDVSISGTSDTNGVQRQRQTIVFKIIYLVGWTIGIALLISFVFEVVYLLSKI